MTFTESTTTRLSLLGLAAVLLTAWFCYRPALSGDFQLDDRSNLSGLEAVEDYDTAVDFVLSGSAGPTGRPLALLSFALQAEQWNEGARAFLATNIAIHLLNAILLAACLFQLSRLQGIARDQSAFIAVLATGCWVLMPLLASATLLVVQRMTTLSATFVLLGLLGYLFARRNIDTHPGRSLALMGLILTLATVAATLVKETGILLPLFVLILEHTVLPMPTGIRRRQWYLWQAVFFGIPAVVVLAVLGSRLPYPDWLVVQRGFTAWERVISELPILWVYLKKALIGLPSDLGVYQVAPPIRRSLFEPAVFIAGLAWVGLAGAAIVLRRRWLLFSLAILWFLAGHLIESTVVPLELYFEHRNYLPIVGPVFAGIAMLVCGSGALQRIAAVIVPAYIILNATLLYSVASTYGEPSRSSRYWAFQYPESVRAVTTMATYQLVEEGAFPALATIDGFAGRYPQHGYLRVQELNIRCQVMPGQDHSEVIAQLRNDLPAVEFTFTAGTMLSQLMDTITRVECNGIDLATVEELANRLRGNPRYTSSPGYTQFHHRLMASMARQRGEPDRAVEEIRLAIDARPSRELNMMMVTALGAQGEFTAAQQFIDDARDRGPRHPLRSIAWQRELDQLHSYIRELERYSRSEE